jgi:hypothetical protein
MKDVHDPKSIVKNVYKHEELYLEHKKEIDLGDGTAKTEYRLQQMWQGSGGNENWMWVEYVD